MQSQCKNCSKERHSLTWTSRQAGHYKKASARRDILRKWMQELKAGQPCTDCAGIFHHSAMQWDHLPGTNKVTNVSMMPGFSKERILEEISKCQLVCANCHAVRTYNRCHAGVA